MAAQFWHEEVYARQPNGKKISVKDVVREGLRDQARGCRHVSYPMRPYATFKGDLSPEKFIKALDHLIEETEAKTGKKTPKTASVMLGGIASYPKFVVDVEQDPEVFAHFQKWSELNLQWIEKRFKTNFVVMWHFDELYPHIHYWVMGVEHKGMISASELHPGRKAHKDFDLFKINAIKALHHMESAGHPVEAIKTALNECFKLGYMGCYRNAMAEMNEDYYESVGKPCGFTKTLEIPKKWRFTKLPGVVRLVGPKKEFRKDKEQRVAEQESKRLMANWEVPIPKRPF